MNTKIFVNLPVKDLNASIDFFSKLGFTFNPQFTDQNATCMIINSDIYVMLLVESFFKTFTKKEISDAFKNTEVIIALSFESRDKVDELVDKALAAGAKKTNEPNDQGWMYERSFQDIDGHLWEMVYMNPDAVKGSSKN
jgi:predicted lactoylglutathione lyase